MLFSKEYTTKNGAILAVWVTLYLNGKLDVIIGRI